MVNTDENATYLIINVRDSASHSLIFHLYQISIQIGPNHIILVFYAKTGLLNSKFLLFAKQYTQTGTIIEVQIPQTTLMFLLESRDLHLHIVAVHYLSLLT